MHFRGTRLWLCSRPGIDRVHKDRVQQPSSRRVPSSPSHLALSRLGRAPKPARFRTRSHLPLVRRSTAAAPRTITGSRAVHAQANSPSMHPQEGDVDGARCVLEGVGWSWLSMHNTLRSGLLPGGWADARWRLFWCSPPIVEIIDNESTPSSASACSVRHLNAIVLCAELFLNLSCSYCLESYFQGL